MSIEFERAGSTSPRERLATITSRPLTPLNINTYHQEALNAVITLSESVLHTYEKQHPEVLTLPKSQREDLAFEASGLQSIPEILTLIAEKKEEVDALDAVIDKNLTFLSEVIVPTDEHIRPNMVGGGEKYEARQMRGQVKTVLYLLAAKGIDLQTVSLQQGELLPTMMRKTSYTSVTIPSLNRIVLICDEEGNASYVFDSAQLGLDVTEKLIQMSKTALNKFVQSHPESGIRIIGNKVWAERMDAALFAEVNPKPSAHTVEWVPASTDELDPWRGFYTDASDGKHYGSLKEISRRLRVSDAALIEKVEDLPHRYVRRSSTITQAYAFEDVKPLVPESEFPFVSEEGEWAGFYSDPVDKKHYTSLGLLTDKLHKASDFFLARVAGLTTKQLRRGSQVFAGYAIEDLQKLLPQNESIRVAEEGEWEEFWVNPEDGEHYGLLQTIVFKIRRSLDSTNRETSISYQGLRRRILKAQLKPTTIADRFGNEGDGYSFEAIQRLLVDLSGRHLVAQEGAWAGFYEQDGKHYGSMNMIAKRLNVFKKVIHDFIAEHPTTPFVRVRNKRGILSDGYCFEEVKAALDERERAHPRVAEEGEWAGFHEQNGEHFGNISLIAKRLKVSYQILRRVVNEKASTLTSVNIRGSVGTKGLGYSFEAVEVLARNLGLVTQDDT